MTAFKLWCLHTIDLMWIYFAVALYRRLTYEVFVWGYVLYLVYIIPGVHSICGVLYPVYVLHLVYALPGVRFTRCVLYSVYALPDVCFTRYMLNSMSLISCMCFNQLLPGISALSGMYILYLVHVHSFYVVFSISTWHPGFFIIIKWPWVFQMIIF